MFQAPKIGFSVVGTRVCIGFLQRSLFWSCGKFPSHCPRFPNYRSANSHWTPQTPITITQSCCFVFLLGPLKHAPANPVCPIHCSSMPITFTPNYHIFQTSTQQCLSNDLSALRKPSQSLTPNLLNLFDLEGQKRIHPKTCKPWTLILTYPEK